MKRDRINFRHRNPLRLIERRTRLRRYVKGLVVALVCGGVIVPLMMQ